jgi:hypothetical protein
MWWNIPLAKSQFFYFQVTLSFCQVDAFGRELSKKDILFGKSSGWNSLEEKTRATYDGKKDLLEHKEDIIVG